MSQNASAKDWEAIAKEIESSSIVKILEVAGISKDVWIQLLRNMEEQLSNKSISTLASESREMVLDKAPHILDIFNTVAEEWPKFASELRILGTKISTGSAQDYESIQLPPNGIIANLAKHLFTLHLAPSALAELLFDLAGHFSDMAIFAREELDKFWKKEPGVIAAFMTFSSIATVKPHEFLAGLTVNGEKPSMTDSRDYNASLFAALMLNRPDFIKSINFKVSNTITCATIEHHYVELGGEQHVLETIGQSCMEKSSTKIAEMPLRQTRTAIDDAFKRISNLLTAQQRQEIGLLQSKARLEELGKPISLDTAIDKDGQDTETLESVLPAGQDMDTAIPTYYSAVSTLPEDIQPIFYRVIEKGESPKEAALNLGFEWTPALERKLERMKKKIYGQMI